jgi:alpha-D-ribose 1-methylphosphonate 5-triphosphate synthase subunit PhnG
MEVLSLSDPADLEAGILGFEAIPSYVYLKKPASGLVMVRGRIGGTGRAVNIGEMLVSRCIVDLSGTTGYGYTPFEDLRHSELAALIDALAEHPDYRDKAGQMLAALESRIKERELAEIEETESTKVEFFTLKRGEDD